MRSFSLKSFLVAIVILALLLAYGTLQFRYWKLGAEVLQLRLEGGHLVPVDKRRVNVIQVPSSDPHLFRWRVHAPPGTLFDYGFRINNIPEEGIPSPLMGGNGRVVDSIESGVLISLVITPKDDGGHNLLLGFGTDQYHRTSTQIPLDEWFEGNHLRDTAGTGGAEAFDYDQPIILTRRRLADPITGIISAGESRGFIFWLIPKRKP